jgi:hypothetical protein
MLVRSQVVIKGLDIDTNYDIQVVAYRNGSRIESPVQSINTANTRTAESVLMLAYTQSLFNSEFSLLLLMFRTVGMYLEALSVRGTDSNDIVVEWENAVNVDPNAVVVGYELSLLYAFARV